MKYVNVKVDTYENCPDRVNQIESMYGSDTSCLPVDPYGALVGQKGDPAIMDKTQYNIRDRFGYDQGDESY